ncbi:AAA family ATPase [Campylobacter sp. MIT 99-7217]|uniref:ATP-binding protein n=1 Tax=Campylobacter sp. MIT 99-7217 TaxID=535091 RepID=UPI0011570100|nr:ATP-binding protein [Campylobacter sp. MIT 99-7217]TQR34516.1 AAA family ATPase [Campylobacter sp. MIT 99-7217]
MKELKAFLKSKDVSKSEIFKALKISYDEGLILQYLCQLFFGSIPNISILNLLQGLFKDKEEFSYLDHLKDIRHLMELGLVKTGYSMLQDQNKESLFSLLHMDISLSEYFLQFLENKKPLDLSINVAYENHLEYLKDEFERIKLYTRLSFNPQNLDFKKDIQAYEAHIKKRLAKSKFYNVLAEIFKENKLSKKEQIIFIALLKEEYSLKNEESSSRELNSLLALVSENELEKLKNRALLDENSKLIEKNLIDYDEFSNHFYLSESILQRIVNFKRLDKDKQLRLENALKDQEIFELIEPNTDINDVIMPAKTKELLENILKQQDKKVLERLSLWGIKNSKEVEAKIIFYGPAGTGKTMSALSMAKSMKKVVLSFDCSKILSKWVGESEQNVRKIFDTYKEIAQNCKQSPILLLNEADQFLSTRVESGASADKMHNQMQNIFLEQIEKFSGVIIATTNFLESLDSAFSRRFEYKIEFKKPNFKERFLIWQKALPKNAEFSEDFKLDDLAQYELSGAQIFMVVKNTALKVAVSKDGIFSMQDFRESIEKELSSSFDKSKIVGF